MLNIRPAQRDDAALIRQFIYELAVYERAPEAVVATPADIERDGWGPDPKFRCVIAEWDGQPAGFALFFYNYSTWLGRHGLYLEDLFVRPELRGKGIGKALLAHLAEIARRENCYGMRWQVLDWNQPSIDFYEALGSEIQREWLPVRLMGEPMERLAKQAK